MMLPGLRKWRGVLSCATSSHTLCLGRRSTLGKSVLNQKGDNNHRSTLCIVVFDNWLRSRWTFCETICSRSYLLLRL